MNWNKENWCKKQMLKKVSLLNQQEKKTNIWLNLKLIFFFISFWKKYIYIYKYKNLKALRIKNIPLNEDYGNIPDKEKIKATLM